jgi:protein-disulfide isomerase
MAKTGRRTKDKRGPSRAVWLVLGGLGTLALLTAALLAMRPAEEATLEPGDDPTLGMAEAPVTIYYFADFQCSHCADFELGGGLDALRAQHIESGDVRLVAKDFPILGDDSWRAAQASQYVWEHAPGSYWAWHHGLFERQGAPGWASTDGLVAYTSASFPGIDADDLRAALDEERYEGEVRADFEAGEDVGVRSTPTLVIAGRNVNANDADAVERAIQDALAQARGPA